MWSSATHDMDTWWRHVYAYYVAGGFHCTVASQVLQCVTFGFTVWFSAFLFLGIHWSRLFDCTSSGTCASIDIVAWPPQWSWLIIVYLVMLHLYWIWYLVYALQTIYYAMQIRRELHDRLQVPHDAALCTITWTQLVERVQRRVPEWTPERVRHNLLRYDNLFAALMQQNALNLFRQERGLWWSWSLYGNILHWYVRAIVFPGLVHELEMGHVHANVLRKWKWRLRCLAFTNLVMLPFVLVFTWIYFVLKHAEEAQNRQHSLRLCTHRQWCMLAQILCRRVNELSHEFQHRLMYRVRRHVNQYLEAQPVGMVHLVAQTVAYVCGAFVAILVLLTLIDSSILLNHTIGDRNLMWYLALFSACLAISRSFMPNEDQTANALGPQPELIEAHLQDVDKVLELSLRRHSSEGRESLPVHLPYMYRTRIESLWCETVATCAAPYMLGVELARDETLKQLWNTLRPLVPQMCAVVRDEVNVQASGRAPTRSTVIYDHAIKRQLLQLLHTPSPESGDSLPTADSLVELSTYQSQITPSMVLSRGYGSTTETNDVLLYEPEEQGTSALLLQCSLSDL